MVTHTDRMTSGIPGLDHVLDGGFPKNRLYLIQGEPGAGKTTMGLQLLLEGAKQGEHCLYITLSESKSELHAVAGSHGWTLDALRVYEMSAAASADDTQDEENTLYVPAEVELSERLNKLLLVVDEVKPARVIVDSCSELRLLAQSPLRFRRQLVALKEELVKRGCTIFLIDNPLSLDGDPLLQSLVHGVVTLEQLAPEYGAQRRRMRIKKMREVRFRGGFHDFNIGTGGIVLFPRLVASEHGGRFVREHVSSGVPGIDALLGGGLDRGTSALFMGPAGSGKSALASQYAVAAALRGERAAMFTFDEGKGTLLERAAGLGMRMAEMVDKKMISIQQVDPAELSPGELVHAVRVAVEEQHARIIVIDSLNGYLQAMPADKYLEVQLHELLSYLRQKGVLTILVVAQHGFVGPIDAPIEVSYLADTVVLTRYYELGGRVHKALSVLKKRSGKHETTIRELRLDDQGVDAGPPLERFQGVLTGTPIVDCK
jgi:circadian clock protein KaiC